MSFCDGDGAFGPQSTCRTFDFTVVFENSILSLIPAGLFLLTCTVFLSRARPSLAFSLRNALVAIPSALLSVTAILSLAAWSTASVDLPPVAHKMVTAALSLGFVSAIVLVVLVPVMGRSRYILFVASLYLLLTLVLDAARVRTFAMVGSEATSKFFFASFLAQYACRFLCLVTLSFPSLFVSSQENGLENAGFLSHVFVLWALPLMWKGRHGDMEIEHLPQLDSDMETTKLYARFEVTWKAERAKHGDNASLARALGQAFYPTFLGPVVPAALRSLAQAVEPLMVNAIIRFLESYSTVGQVPKPAQQGWALAGAFAIVFLGLAGVTGQYFYYVYRGGAYIRAALVEAIYRKTLTLSADSLADAAGGDASNLMSVDIERITLAIDPLHQLWSSLIVIAIGLYILWTQIGTAFVAAVIVTAVCMIATPLLSRHIDDLQEAWSSVTDSRVRLISSVIHQITGVKLSAYEPELTRKVEDVRQTELTAMKRFWKDFAVVVCVTNTAMNMLSLFTLGAYAIVSFLSGSGSLTTARLFTSYTVLTIIAAPLFSVGQNYGTVLAAYGSLKRIQSYLNAPERTDLRSEDLSIVDRKDVHLDEKSGELGQDIGTFELRGTFGWKDKRVLDDINLQIPVGKVTAIIGRVGSGKTTLLQSLLGETTTFGSISRTPIRGDIAFCSQVPWLRTSLSVEQNILFSSPMERGWFNTVVRACALDIDFASTSLDSRLAKGLSGGQKARIALARAVYSRNAVVILDDVFAALDGTTSASVFEALFGPSGLLRGRTVVMATNKISHLPHVDWIANLFDARISEQGTYEQLASSEGPAGALIREHSHSTAAAAFDGEQQNTAFDDTVEDIDKAEAEQEEIDAIQHGSNGVAAYAHYFAGAGYPSMLIYAIFLVVTVAIQIVTPVYLQLWAAANDSGSGSASSVLGRYLGGYAAVEVAYSIAFTTVFYFFIMRLVPGASTALHANAFDSVMAAPMSFFDGTSAGKIISRFSQDIFILDFEFPLAMHDCGYESTRMVGSAILMIVSVPYLAIVVAFMLVLVYVIQKFYLATSRQLRRLDLSSKGPLYTLFAETVELNGLLTIRAAQKSVPYTAANSALLARSQMPFYLTNVSRLWLATTIGVMTAVINTCFVLIAVGRRNTTSAGLFAVGLSQAVSLQDIISLVLTSWTQLEIAAVAIERNLEYTRLPPEEDGKAPHQPEDGSVWPTDGAIECENVVARYDGQTEPTLKEISWSAPGGTNVGLCGRTGSGKSTVLLAILRALHVHGKILIDKKDTAQIPRRTLRRNITVVPQEPLVIDGTVRENVDLSGEKTDAEIWEAIEASQLKDVVSAFDEKLDQPLTARGNELSKGQTQLLALARALLRKNKIVLMDEATGNLDVETDKAVQETIRAAFKDYTVVTVAHRIGTIMDYDQVAVLDAGRIVEVGRPSQLAEDEQSAFARLRHDSRM